MERTTRSRIFETILSDASCVSTARRPRPAAALSLQSAGVTSLREFKSARERAQRAEDHGDDETAAAEYLCAIQAGDLLQITQLERIQLLICLARCQHRRRRFSQARLALQEAEKVIDASTTPAVFTYQLVEIEAHLGSLEFAQGDVRRAVDQLTSAIKRYEEACTIDPARLARLYVMLSSIYAKASLYDNAMEEALKGLSFLEQCSEEVNREKMRMFQLLATIACKKDKREAAVRHLMEAYKFAGLLASQRDLIELEVLLATVYALYGQDHESCTWCEAAIRRQEATEQKLQWSASVLYLCLGQLQARSAPDKAVQTFHCCLDLQLSNLYLNTLL